MVSKSFIFDIKLLNFKYELINYFLKLKLIIKYFKKIMSRIKSIILNINFNKNYFKFLSKLNVYFLILKLIIADFNFFNLDLFLLKLIFKCIF